jgi:hypothetical protein
MLAQKNQVVTRTVLRSMGLSGAERGPARSELGGESAVIRRHAMDFLKQTSPGTVTAQWQGGNVCVTSRVIEQYRWRGQPW